jgi:hypothetical protein
LNNSTVLTLAALIAWSIKGLPNCAKNQIVTSPPFQTLVSLFVRAISYLENTFDAQLTSGIRANMSARTKVLST